MGALSARIVATAAAGTLATSGLVGLSTVPAHADATACVAYLKTQGQSSVFRTVTCDAAEAVARTVSPQFAQQLCELLMRLSGLPTETAQAACSAAVSEVAARARKAPAH